jgi:UDP-MurNAc hydroxylase
MDLPQSVREEFPAERIADHQTDWVNSLLLSMRFRARRIGPYNEYLYTFCKCLAADRLMYAEG